MSDMAAKTGYLVTDEGSGYSYAISQDNLSRVVPRKLYRHLSEEAKEEVLLAAAKEHGFRIMSKED